MTVKPPRLRSNEARTSPYHDPELAAWLGSFEGVPDWLSQQSSAPPEDAGPWRQRAHQGMHTLGQLLPGAGLAIGLALLAQQGAVWLGVNLLGYAESPLSPILLAILLGLILRNTVGLPDLYEAGLRLCVKRLLRLGIVMLGAGMSFAAVGRIGLLGAPVVIGCITVALLAVTWLSRLMTLPRRLGSLIAVGTSICGVSAIVATSPVIGAEEDETSYAVATIALFGMLTLFAYPFLAHWMFAGDPTMAGLFLGTAIHDTSQVAGAGLTFQQQFAAPAALNTAIVTKLLRNLCMVAVIPVMGMLYHRRQSQQTHSAASQQTVPLHRMVPLFVMGFLAMTVIRSIGDMSPDAFGLIPPDTWQRGIGQLQHAGQWCLAIAMAAVGLNTRLARLKNLGLKPFLMGLAAALLVGAGSILLVFVTTALAARFA